MGEHLMKHIEILKTIPEIKESIEELKLGCYIETLGVKASRITKIYNKMDALLGDGVMYFSTEVQNKQTKGEIIGAIEERHLRMFFQKKGISICIGTDGLFISSDFTACRIERWQYDNSKPYMEQSEDFFQKLNEFLINEFNIKI